MKKSDPNNNEKSEQINNIDFGKVIISNTDDLKYDYFKRRIDPQNNGVNLEGNNKILKFNNESPYNEESIENNNLKNKNQDLKSSLPNQSNNKLDLKSIFNSNYVQKNFISGNSFKKNINFLNNNSNNNLKDYYRIEDSNTNEIVKNNKNKVKENTIKIINDSNNSNNSNKQNQIIPMDMDLIFKNKNSLVEKTTYLNNFEESTINKNLSSTGYSNDYTKKSENYNEKIECNINIINNEDKKEKNNILPKDNKNDLSKLKYQSSSDVVLIEDISQKINKFTSLQNKKNTGENNFFNNFLSNKRIYFNSEKIKINNNNIPNKDNNNKIEESNINNRIEINKNEVSETKTDNKNLFKIVENQDFSKNKIFNHINNINNINNHTAQKKNLFNYSGISENSTNFDNTSKNNLPKSKKNSIEFQNLETIKDTINNNNSFNLNFPNKNNNGNFTTILSSNYDGNIKNNICNNFNNTNPNSYQNSNFSNHNHNNYINIFNINLMQPKDINLISNTNLTEAFNKNENDYVDEISKETTVDNFSNNLNDKNKIINFFTKKSKNEIYETISDPIKSSQMISDGYKIPYKKNQNNSIDPINSNFLNKNIFDDKKIISNSNTNNIIKNPTNKKLNNTNCKFSNCEINYPLNKKWIISGTGKNHISSSENLSIKNDTLELSLKDEIIINEEDKFPDNSKQVNLDIDNDSNSKNIENNKLDLNIKYDINKINFFRKISHKESREETLNPFNINFNVEEENKFINNVYINNNKVYTDYINDREEDEFLGFDIFPNS